MRRVEQPVGGHPQTERRPLIVTIDGPAGTGKSTVAHGLASRLGLDYLDTGAMYRAAALIALRQKIDPTDGSAIARAVSEAGLRFNWESDPPELLVGDEPVADEIRRLRVNQVVSEVAAQPQVRELLVKLQQRIGREHPRLVSEGRDQGSVVFPDAALRFYLHAQVAVRARRRAAQIDASGEPVDRQRVIADIEHRDRLDSSRADGPLVQPEGAIVMDTSERSVDEVISLMEAIARELCPDAAFAQ